MKQLICIAIYCLFVKLNIAQQKNIDSNWVRLGNSFIEKNNPDLPFLRFDGSGIIDIRTATPTEKQKLAAYTRIQSIIADNRFNSLFSSLFDKESTIYIGVQHPIKDTVFYGYGQDNANIAIVQAQAPIEFAAVNITPQNAHLYRYRVIENDDKAIIPWNPITQFVTTNDKKVQYAYLGKFEAAPNRYLKVEVANSTNYKDQSFFIADWRKVEPFHFQNVFVQYTIKRDRSSIFSDVLSSTNPYTQKIPKTFIDRSNKDLPMILMGDSLLSIDVRNGKQNFIKYMVTLSYKNNKETSSIILGETVNQSLNIPRALWEKPGIYTITYTPRLATIFWEGQRPGQMNQDILLKNLASSFLFQVLPPKNKAFSIPLSTLVWIGAGTLFIILATFWFIRQKHRMQLLESNYQKDINSLELASVRTQLNPHFLFNAIANIQNLMYKNETEKAANYLNIFSKITRSILDTTQQEAITIHDECNLLKGYLDMEQLRFHFQYTIELDKDISASLEIPTMLLQPIVENAIKHGIGHLQEAGTINITFQKHNQDLLIYIHDNGNGFDTTKNTNGKGIQLTKKRIELLNTVYKATLIKLNFVSSKTGSTVEFQFSNWLQ